MYILGKALRIRIEKFKQTLSENYSKSIKYTACKFSKIFRSSMPPDLPRAFLVSQLAPTKFCQKNRLEKMWKYMCFPGHLSFKISRFAIVYAGNIFLKWGINNCYFFNLNPSLSMLLIRPGPTPRGARPPNRHASPHIQQAFSFEDSGFCA